MHSSSLPPDGALTDGRMPSAPASTLGRYRLVSELARGGMSVVHLGLMRGPARFHKLLVLKELKPSLAQDPKLVELFLAEARLAARLNHPHVVQTIEVGSDGARHYIVMEYLDGRPLSQLLARARAAGQPLPLHAHLAVIAAALEGLAYAHTASGYDGRPLGLVHRDVSPQNIFVTYDGQVKLLDFGIAKAADMAGDTASGVLKGKIAYMAPEQAAGRAVDARVDVFAAGVMLFEAATRRRFWANAGNEWQIVQSLVRSELPTRERDALVGVDSELRWIIQTCLAIDPADRYPNAAPLLDDLRPLLRKLTPASFTTRDLAQRMRDLFAADRAQMQALIGAQLDDAASASLDATDDFSALSGATPGSIGPIAAPWRASLSAALGRAGPGTRLAGIAVAGLGAALALGVVYAAGSSRRAAEHGAIPSVPTAAAGSSRRPAQPSQAAPRDGTASPGAPSGPAQSEGTASPDAPSGPAHADAIDVRATPAWSHIWIDGRPVSNPYVAPLARDGAHHTLAVEAGGFLPWVEAFDGAGSFVRVVALRPRGHVAGASSGAPSPALAPAAPSPPSAASTELAAPVRVRPIDVSNPYER